LKQELEKKNHEIELLKSTINHLAVKKENQSKEVSRTDNFNFIISRKPNSKLLNIVSLTILLVCLIACLFEHSVIDTDHTIHQSTNIIPMKVYSRQRKYDNVTNNTDIRLYKEMIQRLNMDHVPLNRNHGKVSNRACMNKLFYVDYTEVEISQ